MKKLEKILTGFSYAVNCISIVIFSILIIFIVVDVLRRTFLNSPFSGSVEVVEQLAMVGVFCGFAYAQMKGANIHINMLLLHFPRKLSIFIYGIGELISCAGGVWLFLALVGQTQLAIAKHYMTTILKISMVPGLVLVTIATLIMSIAMLFSAIDTFYGLVSKEKAAELEAEMAEIK